MEKHQWKKTYTHPKTNIVPACRWGHSTCVINDDIVCFGGYADSTYMNDVWKFNTTTMEWTEVVTTGLKPSERSNCAMNYDHINQRIIVFAGGGHNKKRFNTINILCWKTKQWTEIVPKDNEPAPWERTYHSAQLFYPYLVAFGGEGAADLDDLWVFNFNTMAWKEIVIPKDSVRPCARRFHSSARIGNQFYVLAGCYSKYRCLSDVFSMDLTPLLEKDDVQSLQWRQRRVEGNSFLTRWGHSSTVFNGEIYVFGGRFSSDLNDLIIINPQRNSMRTMKVGFESPKPRRRHSGDFVGSCLVIFGGFNGQYFNDLNFINVLELKKKPPFALIQYDNYVNSVYFADRMLQTNQQEDLCVHTAIIALRFQSSSHLQELLNHISGNYSKQQLLKYLQSLYLGYGKVPPFWLLDYKLKIYQNSEQKNQQDLKALGKIIGKPTNNRKKGLSTKNRIVELQGEQFNEFIQRPANTIHNTSRIWLNEQESILVNGTLLRLSSAYFCNLLENNHEIKLSLGKEALGCFKMMVGYLQLGYLVVQRAMGQQKWMQLGEMANYFAVLDMVSLVQDELINHITQFNYQELFEFAIQLGLDNLTLCCARIRVRNEVVVHQSKQTPFQNESNTLNNSNGTNKEEKYSLKLRSFSSKNETEQAKSGCHLNKNNRKNRFIEKQQRIMSMVYSLLRFQLIQEKIYKDVMVWTLRKTQQGEQYEKQNYENYIQ